jgi:pyruvate/2-oxoglutarate dehydrogenase complex dihydrolipoamide acyltransferase (E2) component|nr:dihydrolipoamide succinyltransferase component (E2) of 2-oxoglutarate dehydrogenase complex [uncultured bacterium]
MNTTIAIRKSVPKARKAVKDFLDLAHGKNFAHGMTEVDVTNVLRVLAERKRIGLDSHSLVAHTIWSYGRAVADHVALQGIPSGGEIVVFEDVDIATMVEKELPEGGTVPYPYILRGAQRKSFEEIVQDLNQAKAYSLADAQKAKATTRIDFLPRFLRLWIMRKALRNPLKYKAALGTVALTTLGMVMRNRRWWPVPIGPHAISIGTGATFKRNDASGEKDILCVSLRFDHDLMDGAPITRFGSSFVTYLESSDHLQISGDES